MTFLPTHLAAALGGSGLACFSFGSMRRIGRSELPPGEATSAFLVFRKGGLE